MDVAASVYPKRVRMNHKYGQQSDRLTRGPLLAWRGICAVEIDEIFNTRPEAWLFKGHYTWLWNKPAALIYSDDFFPPSMLFRKTRHLDKKAVHIILYMSCFYLYQHHSYIRLYSGGYTVAVIWPFFGNIFKVSRTRRHQMHLFLPFHNCLLIITKSILGKLSLVA